MSNFYTRPHFEDRQIVQYVDESIKLSGITTIASTVLDFTGTTTADTSVTISSLTGYLNGNRLSGFVIEPPTLLQSGTTGTTTVDVTGWVLTSYDSGGTVMWATSTAGLFTGNTSATCISDLYISNLHGCSPITVWDNLQTVGSLANGLSSVALGIGNTADGIGSASFGGGTTAFGSASFAEGYQSLALGDSSHVEGYQNIAGYKALTASTAVSFGVVTISDNIDYSSEFTSGIVLLNNELYTYTGTSYSAPNFTIGLTDFGAFISPTIYVADYNNFNSPLAYTSTGNNSHAEGNLSLALGNDSHAEGYLTRSIGNYSHSAGYQTTAYGFNSHAEGYQTSAIGNYSRSEGYSTVAFGGNSHAEGDGTIAYGLGSHAQGLGTFAVGEGSHTEGTGTNAYGFNSHAGGSGSTVSGETSFIHSFNSLLAANRSVLLGGLGLTGTTDDTVYVPYFNINNLGTGTSINNLGIDSSGNVVTGTFGGGGVSIDPYENSIGVGPSIVLNISGQSTNHDISITANTTVDLINVRNGEYGTVIVNQDAIGSKTITLGTVNGSITTHRVVNGGGGSPALTATALAIDILSFTYNGSTMFWTVGNDYT